MEGILKRGFFSKIKEMSNKRKIVDNLSQGKIGKEYKVTQIQSNDKELENFLFSLGCYEGEIVTLISILSDNYVINIKDGRYSIDQELAKVIKVEEV